MSMKQDESSDIQALLFGLENELHGLMKREHAEIRDELSQMGLVVSDAISTLMQSLNGLSEQIKEQNELVRNIATAAGNTESEKKQQAYHALSDKVNQNINAVVRSFQFEDIVQQLVSHCRARSDGLEQLVDQLNENVNKLKNSSQGDAKQVFSVMRTDIAKVRKELEKENPVKQTSMGVGEIELF